MNSMYEALLIIARGEPIEAVVIGDYTDDTELVDRLDPDWRTYYEDVIPNYNKIPRGVVLTLEAARPFLEVIDIDGAYSLAIAAWTTTSCIYSTEYDGGHWLMRMPRNPTAFMPVKAGC